MEPMSTEPRRSQSVNRHLTLVADLLRGREHDRQSLAKRLGVQPAMADRLGASRWPLFEGSAYESDRPGTEERSVSARKRRS